ncbi:NINE protein [Alloiococcus sp. CFN-8]|uniref:NINE protein n=1 Tax=Alloiococcus sp. CFN-8 TaxID=3416081 RepID=UPI003CF214DB
MELLDFLIILFLGPLGVHKFKEGNIRLGLIYLFTMGIFFFGWVLDLARALSLIMREGIINE